MKVAILFGTVCCFCIFALPVPIATIIIASNNSSDDCQDDSNGDIRTVIGLSLANWLFVAGFVMLGQTFYALLATIAGINYGYNYVKNSFKDDDVDVNDTIFFIIKVGQLTSMTVIIDTITGLFYILWVILGGIILFRDNKDCYEDGGVSLGIMSFFVWLWLALTICNSGESLKTHLNRF